MSHTPRALSILAQVSALRTQANELARGVDRRHGSFGYTNESQAEALFSQARALEATVLIPFKAIPAFDFHVRDCTAAYQERERIRVLAGVTPRVRKALEDIERMALPGGYSCSLWSSKNHSRRHA